MTETQLAKIKELALRVGSSLDFCDVSHGHEDFPRNWIALTVNRKGTPPGKSDPVLLADIGPGGEYNATF